MKKKKKEIKEKKRTQQLNIYQNLNEKITTQTQSQMAKTDDSFTIFVQKGLISIEYHHDIPTLMVHLL